MFFLVFHLPLSRQSTCCRFSLPRCIDSYRSMSRDQSRLKKEEKKNYRDTAREKRDSESQASTYTQETKRKKEEEERKESWKKKKRRERDRLEWWHANTSLSLSCSFILFSLFLFLLLRLSAKDAKKKVLCLRWIKNSRVCLSSWFEEKTKIEELVRVKQNPRTSVLACMRMHWEIDSFYTQDTLFMSSSHFSPSLPSFLSFSRHSEEILLFSLSLSLLPDSFSFFCRESQFFFRSLFSLLIDDDDLWWFVSLCIHQVKRKEEEEEDLLDSLRISCLHVSLSSVAALLFFSSSALSSSLFSSLQQSRSFKRLLSFFLVCLGITSRREEGRERKLREEEEEREESADVSKRYGREREEEGHLFEAVSFVFFLILSFFLLLHSFSPSSFSFLLSFLFPWLSFLLFSGLLVCVFLPWLQKSSLVSHFLQTLSSLVKRHKKLFSFFSSFKIFAKKKGRRHERNRSQNCKEGKKTRKTALFFSLFSEFSSLLEEADRCRCSSTIDLRIDVISQSMN